MTTKHTAPMPMAAALTQLITQGNTPCAEWIPDTEICPKSLITGEECELCEGMGVISWIPDIEQLVELLARLHGQPVAVIQLAGFTMAQANILTGWCEGQTLKWKVIEGVPPLHPQGLVTVAVTT